MNSVTVVDGKVICDWFAKCKRPATGVVDHPTLGYVPTCTRCAAITNQVLVPAVFNVDITE